MSRATVLRLAIVTAASTCLFAGASFAQDEIGAKSTSGVREDVGDIRPAPEEGEAGPTFRGSANLQSQFVTNAKMRGDHSSGDVLFLPSLEGGVNVPFSKKFSLDALGRVENVLYSHYSDRGFFGFSGMVTVNYVHAESWPTLYAGVEPYWYQGFDTGDKLSSAIGYLAGIEQSWAFNRGKSLAFVGYKFTSYYASPSTDNRNQHTALAGLAHQFQPSLVGQVYYAYQYSEFRNQTRRDHRNLVSAVLTKQWSEKFFTSLSSSWIDNGSSNPVAEYQNATAGLTLTYRF